MATPSLHGHAKASSDATEWQARVDLAACFRLVALHGWDDFLATHISARMPDQRDEFLVNPLGLMFEEITASCLVRVRLDGTQVTPSPYGINPAGFTIHSAIHEVRPDAHCVLHLHSDYGTAVSALEAGLQPVTQTAMLVEGDLAYHEYEGVALDLDERPRLQADLGERHYMLLRNHGTLVTGASVAEAFLRAYTLEKACAAQVRALSMGRPVHPVDDHARRKTHEFAHTLLFSEPNIKFAWEALLRKLERAGSDHAR